MIWLWILGGLCLLALLILLVGGSYLLFRFAVIRRRRRPSMADAPAPENDRSVWAAWRPVIEEGKAWFLAQGPEQVEITSFDGLEADRLLPALLRLEADGALLSRLSLGRLGGLCLRAEILPRTGLQPAGGPSAGARTVRGEIHLFRGQGALWTAGTGRAIWPGDFPGMPSFCTGCPWAGPPC